MTGGSKGTLAQVRFRSRTEHTLDEKGRLNFPTRFREVLRQLGSETLMIVPWKTHLRAYPLAEWEALETTLLTEGSSQPGLGKWIRYVVGGVVECSLDKQGRIRLPGDLRNDIGILKDVVLTGMLDWVEIWDRDAWNAETDAALDSFDEQEQGLAKLGLF